MDQILINFFKLLDLLRILVEAGATIDKPDRSGVTALMIAANRGYIEMVDFLIKSGSNVNAHTVEGSTPLLMATSGGHRINNEMIRYIINAGANINDKVYDRIRPLLVAIKRSSEHEDSGRLAVQALIEAGADLDVLDLDNEKPLNIAILRGQFGLVEMLVRAGADTFEYNANRVSPLASLIKSNEHRLARLVAGMLPRLRAHDLALIDRKKLFEDDVYLCRFLYGSSELNIIRPLPLRHLCRVSIRKYLGRRADFYIEQLPVCADVRSYLKLEFL